MTVKSNPISIHRYTGLSSDTKPTIAAPLGMNPPTISSTFYEYDTGILYITHDGTNWVEKETVVKLSPVGGKGVTAATFGKPTLQWLKNNGTESNGRAKWVKEWDRYGEWTAKLSPGYQTDDDYGSVSFSVDNIPLTDLESIEWVYRMGATEAAAPNVAIHVFDPTDTDNRADITLSHTHDGLGKATGWRKFELLPATDGLFYYGNNIPATTGLTGNTGTDLYTLAEYQADAVFSTYVIGKITIEFGYYTTGYFSPAHICKIVVNGIDIPLVPSLEEQLDIARDDTAKALRTIPAWTFGEPFLAHAKNSRAYWARNTADPNYHPSGTGWKACLHGRVQTGDDWAALVIPVNELPLPDFNTAEWQYVMASAQSMGVNIVFWTHDPDNFIYRAEITQDATDALVTKTSGRNAHVFNTATEQMFYYGEITGTPDTCPTAGTHYTWAQFQGDSVFSRYTIYKITLEMGWQASGTFDHVFVGDLNLNGTNILLKPRSEADLAPIHDIQANTSAVAISVAPKTPFQLLSLDFHTNNIPKTGEDLTITKNAGGDGLATAGYLDTIILSEDLFVGSRKDYHAAFGEGYEFSEDDELDIAQTNGDTDQTGTDVCWKPI